MKAAVQRETGATEKKGGNEKSGRENRVGRPLTKERKASAIEKGNGRGGEKGGGSRIEPAKPPSADKKHEKKGRLAQRAGKLKDTWEKKGKGVGKKRNHSFCGAPPKGRAAHRGGGN